MKQKNREDFNCVKSYPQCIQWNLGDIPSLGISNGDFLDDMVYAIVAKLCECCGEIDLSTLSLQCLIDKLNNTDPVPRTLLNVLQLIIDNECTLKDLIDNLQAQIDDINNGGTLTLNLKCLAKFDIYGNPLPYDLHSVLQDLITELCDLKDRVLILEGIVVDLQDQIDHINVTPYELPIISTCISANKKLDVSVKDIATSLCSLRNATGTEVQLQTAMANQCPNFNSEFGTLPGWNIAPVNLAQSYSNLEIAFCDVLGRLKIMETTCCGPTCDKIKLGFTVEVDRDLKELTFCFTSGAGTFIPFGFYDCGSVITITDPEGNVATPASTVITQDGCISGISYSSLVGKILTVSIKTKFCLKDRDGNIILICQDCLNKTIDISMECPVCKVCVTADKNAQNAYIDIIYKLNGQYNLLKIFNGQCNYIPSDAIIVAIDRYNTATEVSDCLDTSEIEDDGCFQINWILQDDGGPTNDAWDEARQNITVAAFWFNGVRYPLNFDAEDIDSIVDSINNQIPSGIIRIYSKGTRLLGSYNANNSSNYGVAFRFRTLASLGETCYIEFAGVVGTSVPRFYAVPITDCSNITT